MKTVLKTVCLTACLAVLALTIIGRLRGAPPGESTAPPQDVAASAPSPGATAPAGTEKPFEITEQWFDDAVFIGDSLTGPLYNYTLVNGGLGKAAICYANGYTCRETGPDALLIPYMGRGYTAEELIAETGAKKAFFLVAMNDIGEPVDKLRECWLALIGRVKEKNPEVDIYIQSGTPIYDQFGYFTNDNMALLNDMLKDVCLETGCVYVDITKGLADETGCLKSEYHLDYVHYNGDACAVWIENLKDLSSYSLPPTQ